MWAEALFSWFLFPLTKVNGKGYLNGSPYLLPSILTDGICNIFRKQSRDPSIDGSQL